MALLSVVLDKGVIAEKSNGTQNNNDKKPLGCYVIHSTDDGKFAFLLYDNAKNAVCASQYKYGSLVEVKSAIAVCRENSFFAALEDRTKKWVEYVNHPKFVLFMQDGKYYFRMTLSNEDVVFISKGYDKHAACEKAMNVAMRIVKTVKVYFAGEEVLSGENFKEKVVIKHVEAVVVEEPVAEEVVQDTAIEQPVDQPAVEESVVEEPVVEEPSPEVAEEEAATEEQAEEEGGEGGVVFDNTKKTLWELYAELSPEQRGYFDKIRARAESKEKVRSSESKSAYTILYGRDKVVRLRIRRKAVEAVFFVTDSAFKRLKDGSDAKIKETATVIRVSNDEYLNLALETVDYKYGAINEERAAKKAERKKKKTE